MKTYRFHLDRVSITERMRDEAYAAWKIGKFSSYVPRLLGAGFIPPPLQVAAGQRLRLGDLKTFVTHCYAMLREDGWTTRAEDFESKGLQILDELKGTSHLPLSQDHANRIYELKHIVMVLTSDVCLEIRHWQLEKEWQAKRGRIMREFMSERLGELLADQCDTDMGEDHTF